MQTSCLRHFKDLRSKKIDSGAALPWTESEDKALTTGMGSSRSVRDLLNLLKTDTRLKSRGKASLIPLLTGKTNPPHLFALYSSQQHMPSRCLPSCSTQCLRMGTSRHGINATGAHTNLPLLAGWQVTSPYHASSPRVAPCRHFLADCALVAQVSCQDRWKALHPGERLVAERTNWTEELLKQLKAARHSQPRATWAAVVDSNEHINHLTHVSL